MYKQACQLFTEQQNFRPAKIESINFAHDKIKVHVNEKVKF